jgi:hypothetical protein
MLGNVGTHLPNYAVPIFTAVKKSQILRVNFYFQLLCTFLGGSRLIKRTYPKIRGVNSRTGYSVRDCISDTGRSVGYSYNLQEQ